MKPADPAPTPSTGRRIFERWIFWPLALLLAAAAVELGFRAQRIVAGRPYLDATAAWRVQRLAEENSKISFRRKAPEASGTSTPDPVFAHPYFAFASRTFLRSLDEALVALRAPSDEVQVVLLGAVAAQSFALNAHDRLVEALGAVPRWRGRRVTLWNLTDPMYKHPQQLEIVLYLTALGARPDLVIDISGRNEILLAAANALSDTHPAYPARSAWEPLVQRGASDRAALDLLIEARSKQREITDLVGRLQGAALHCALWAEGALERVERLALDRDLALSGYQRRSEALQHQLVLRGPSPPVEPKQALSTCVNLWYQSTRDLAALCAARDIAFVSVLEPFGEGSPRSAPQASGRGAAKLNAGRRLLATALGQLAKSGVVCIDAQEPATDRLNPREAALAVAGQIGLRLASR